MNKPTISLLSGEDLHAQAPATFELPDLAERLVMAHRYLYYVLSESVVSDGVYDQIEREARVICPPESPVHGVGSSLPDNYSADVRQLANELLTRVKQP